MKYLEGLNSKQLEAVNIYKGSALVLAGAGSGKTRVITRRIVHLVNHHKILPERILAVTFTNKAATEMKERLFSLLGETARRFWVSTFHSAALRILRKHAEKLGYTNNFTIYDSQDQKSLVKKLMTELEIDKNKYSFDYLISEINKAKTVNLSPSDCREQGFSSDVVIDFYDRYQKELYKSDAMDFSDLLINVVKLFQKNPDILSLYQKGLEFIMIDEFQDTNLIQYQFVKLLGAPQNNVFVVGDDDQSIYSFRGGDVSFMFQFEKDYSDTQLVKLEQNYRSTQNILDSAHAVIEKNKERKDKKLWTTNQRGELINLFVGDDEYYESEFVAEEILKLVDSGFKFNDIAIFYRVNAQSRALEESLFRNSIPYRIFGGLKFYERKEIKDILAYLKVIINDKDDQSYARILNVPARGIGKKTFLMIYSLAKENNLSLWEAGQRLLTQNKKLQSFYDLMFELKSSSNAQEIYQLISFIVEKTNYKKKLEESKDPQAISRIENIEELITTAKRDYREELSYQDNLSIFLDKASLSTNGDDSEQEDQYISLMTLHLAKGLEFKTVFFTGLEEGLLPHYNSTSPIEKEEERRLCYVGMTRAMQNLYLLRARKRALLQRQMQVDYFSVYDRPSEFLNDIPGSYLNILSEEEEEIPFEYQSSFKKKKKKIKSSGFKITIADDL